MVYHSKNWTPDMPKRRIKVNGKMVTNPEYGREYRKRNLERVREKDREWYWKNRDKELEYGRRWKEKNREKTREYARKYHRNNKEKERLQKQKVRFKVLSHYSNGVPKCKCCGETHLEFLTIDHIHNNGAEERKTIGSGQGFYYWIIKNNYPEGLQILCYNCNCAKGHYGECPHQRESEK